MATVAELRARIASGAIKPRTGGGDGVGEGTFGVLIESAELGRGENGNKRGKIVCKVVDRVTDMAQIGKKFNVYVQTVREDYLEESIALFSEFCKVWGIAEERIYDRADNMEEIVLNIMTEMNRLAVKNLLYAVIERVDSGKLNAKGKKQFYTNWKEVVLCDSSAEPAPVAPVVAPVAAPVAPVVAPHPALIQPAPVTATVAAPLAPTATSAPAVAPIPVPAPAPVAVGAKKKPWDK